ncbi:hypothetical protein AN215_05975 [Streptomyces abyssalis]|uniref:Glycosyltransferase RgtA/B/C/D-like domain-containing protein n=1 Tax=Streptomyces abyssalis TaxID=933944 RepID=A0A1E7JTT3_9ACTN|nr:hypothetical protein AN215_05975 [Streptomyces abyssalis]
MVQRTAPISAFRTAASGPRPLPWLAGLSASFVLLQLLLVVPGSGMGWDETVYFSQVSGELPAAFFSAPRARGISFLAAPAAALTSSITVVRVYLALLSGAGLFAALWVWRTLLPTRILFTAGALFASLWVTLFYGPTVMPNLWSAFGTLAAAGCFVRAARDRTDRRALAGLALSVVLVALMRPPDALWLVLALTAVSLAVRRWRRPVLLLLLGGALALGSAEWVIESYVRYGGLSARLHRASEIQGGMGWHMAVDDQIRSMDGRTLCRPCDVPWRHPPTALWLLALPLLTVAGVAAAPRIRRAAAAAVPAVVAAVISVPYLFLIDYAAPRFLLPAYALLALPAAEFLWWAAAGRDGRFRRARTGIVLVALTGHVAVQCAVLANTAAGSRDSRRDFSQAAASLQRMGVRPPCVLSGDHAVQLSFYTGCASRQTGGPDASITPGGLREAARQKRVAVVAPPDAETPAFARGWQHRTLPGTSRFGGYQVHLPATERAAR